VDPGLLTILLFGSAILLLFLGLPIAFTLSGLAVVFVLLVWGPAGLLMVASVAYEKSTSFILVAAPLFIFMAIVLEGSGLAEQLYRTMHLWLGAIPGGLASGTVVICAVFAAMAGISAVATVTMGLIALPEILKRGYDRKMVVGCIASGGALGIIIPPSVIAILYGSITGTSVGQLFMGGMVPGLLMAGVLIIFISIRCSINPKVGPPLPKEEREMITWGVRFASLKGVILPLLLILVVLGTIYTGICTPTESAGVGAFGAVICSAINRKLSWKSLKDASLRTFNVTCMFLWIIIGATAFSNLYNVGGASDLIFNIIGKWDIAPIAIIGLMMGVFFILGMFIDPAGMLMICSPVFLPIVSGLGFDQVWFGILFMLSCEMAYITPPFGFSLFYLRAIVPKDMGMTEVYKSVWPYVCCQALVLILVMFFPQIGLWLPNTMR
jgi:tripartite ATP-independent transporter DctM subunit